MLACYRGAMDLSNAPSSAALERDRLAALMDLNILDTLPERDFDDLVRLAAAALGVESAAISLIDERRQWFKARHGIDETETSRDIAFCAHAVKARDALIVPDASLDTRFLANPFVTKHAGIRFYAGIPLILGSGHCLGTLCVFDPAPRPGLTDKQRAVLEDLARLATDLIESRRFRRMGEIAARVVEATSDAVVAADLSGRIVSWNAAAQSMFGRSPEQALGSPIDIIMPPRLAARYHDMLTRAAHGASLPSSGVVEMILIRHNGEEFPVELSLAQWGAADHGQGFAAILRDISARRGLEREHEHAKSFLDSIVTNLPAMLFVKDAESRKYLMVNEAGAQTIGRPAQTMVGSTDLELFPAYGAGYEARDSEAIASAGTHVFESAFTRDDGETVHLRTIRKLIDGPERPGQYVLGISEDVTEIRRKEAEVLRLAHFDTLTGLLNRASFTEKLHAMVQAGEPFAMLSVDLDHFKAVNDLFGHPTGDAVLAQVGQRLAAAVTPSDWVARVGGDEFFVVLSSGALRERAEEAAQAIVEAIGKPFMTERGVAHLGASVGGVLRPEDGTTAEQLRENVDLALYRAKHNGRASACFFNAEMDAAARDRRAITRDLRKAVAAGDITLAYQPVVAAGSGRVTSAEALARWTHTERGPIRPDVFIPLAEENGLIDMLGAQLLHRACRDAQGWSDPVRVAVNLSPLQFLSNRLLETVRAALEVSGLAPDRLQLEVTEGLVIQDVEGTFEQLQQLRRLGIQILIDDFGVGYSSLSYFQRFPFDKVKIDKSFIDEIATSHAAKAIVKAVVGLGEQLGMGVVAEGVETREQAEMLVKLGCTHLQGYLFGAAMPASSIRSRVPGSADAAHDRHPAGEIASES